MSLSPLRGAGGAPTPEPACSHARRSSLHSRLPSCPHPPAHGRTRGKPISARSRGPTACGATCGTFPPGHTTSARRTGRPTPAGCATGSPPGAGTRRSRPSTCSSPPLANGVVELVAPRAVPRQAEEPAWPATPPSAQQAEQLPTYNAYSVGRRRHRAAGLRQLRRARRLRAARAARHLGQGRHRHRALRRLLARHQAEGRRGARRGRLPHLLRSARRRLLRRRRLSAGPVPRRATACSAAACSTCRSTRAIRSRPASAPRRTPSASPSSEATDHHEDSRCCRSPTPTRSRCSPRSAGRSRRPDWRGGAADHLSLGPGPARSISRSRSTGASQPVYDVIARIPGRDGPTSGSCAATTTTPGSTAPRIRSPGMVAVLEEARRSASWLKQGWRPRARSSTRRGTARSRVCWARPSGPRPTPTSCEHKAVAYLNTDGNGRGFLGAGGSHSLERLHQRGGARRRPTRRPAQVWKRSQARRIARGTAESAAEARDRADLRIDALGSGSDYTPFLQHLGIASLNLGFGGETAAASTTRSTTTSAGSPVQRHLLRLRPRAGADGRDAP